MNEDAFSIEHGDFPASHFSLLEGILVFSRTYDQMDRWEIESISGPFEGCQMDGRGLSLSKPLGFKYHLLFVVVFLYL